MLCKLIIIWVNYEKYKKEFFYETLCLYMAVNKMSNLIDFKHLQAVLLFVLLAYARIKTFSSIAGRYYDNKIINVKTGCHMWGK